MQRLPPLRCRLAYRFGRRRRHDDPTALTVPVHGLCVQNHDARRVRRLVPGVIYPARPMRRFRPEGDPPPVACREHRVAAGVADPQPAHARHRPARYPCCRTGSPHRSSERWRPKYGPPRVAPAGQGARAPAHSGQVGSSNIRTPPDRTAPARLTTEVDRRPSTGKPPTWLRVARTARDRRTRGRPKVSVGRGLLAS